MQGLEPHSRIGSFNVVGLLDQAYVRVDRKTSTLAVICLWKIAQLLV